VEKAYIEAKGPTPIQSTDIVNIVNDFQLYQNYPNPFNPSTTIKFNNSKPMHINLDIYSIDGSHVKSLINKQLEAGQHQFSWNGKDKHNKSVASGVYFYRFENGYVSETKRMILMR
jgi:hypothetical protein